MTPGAVVALAGSAGCVPVVVRALKALDGRSDVALFVCYHRGGSPFDLSVFLPPASPFRVEAASTGARVRPGVVYHPPDGQDVVVVEGERLLVASPLGRSRPNIDRLLASLADAYGSRVHAFLLSGASPRDGVAGVARVRSRGGAVVVQDPKEALYPMLPEGALGSGVAADVLDADAIVARVRDLCRAHPPPRPAPDATRS